LSYIGSISRIARTTSITPDLHEDLMLRSTRQRASRRMGGIGASWFETALTRLLTMKVTRRIKAKQQSFGEATQAC